MISDNPAGPVYDDDNRPDHLSEEEYDSQVYLPSFCRARRPRLPLHLSTLVHPRVSGS